MQLYEFGPEAAENVLIQPVGDHDLPLIENEIAEIRRRTEIPFRLTAVKVESWNRDLSPWPAPAVFGNEDFGDGAAALLVHPLRVPAAAAGGDGVDLPHRRKVRARGQLRMVTSSALGAYSPSRDQGSSPAGSAVRVEMWRKIRSSW